MLIKRVPWASQPQYPAGINWGGGFPPPTHLFLPHISGADLASGVLPSVEATFTKKPTSAGVGINVTATGRRYAAGFFNGATSGAWIVIAHRDGSATGTYSVIRHASVVVPVQESNNAVRGVLWKPSIDSGTYYGGGIVYSYTNFQNRVSVFGGRFNGSEARLYLNHGSPRTTDFSSGGTLASDSNPMVFGATESGGEVATPWTILAVAFWENISPSDAAMRRLTESVPSAWQLFAPRSIWVPVSVDGSVTGTSATTNANDTSSASGTTTVVGTSATTNANDTATASGSVGGAVTGTSATTNANDTSSASGTTTITGTVAYSNANDSAAASGWAGSVSGTAAVTNANDTAIASGSAGGGATDTHDGFWSREWDRIRRREKKPTVAEVVEIIKESPQVVEMVREEVEREYPKVDHAAVLADVRLQRFIARQLIEAAQEEDDIETMLLMA